MKKISTQYTSIAGTFAMTVLLSACSNTVSTKPDKAIPKQSAFFERFDINKDRKVTADEFIEDRPDHFKTDDKDGNGTLSRREYITAHHKRQRSRKAKQKIERKNRSFAEMDTDNDGTVDEKEFVANSQVQAKKSFAKMDKDKSGFISSDEYAGYSHQHSRNSMSWQSNPYQMFMEMDTNRDGQLSREEHSLARMKRFDSMDKNGDKAITPEEAEQARNEREKTSKVLN